MEVRKYKENKEKIRKRKEEIRRRRAEALKNSTTNMCTLGKLEESNNTASSAEDNLLGSIPIQDYLISSDEDDATIAECTSPLLDKIVQGDKIVDELDALTSQRSLKRQLPPHHAVLSTLPGTSGALTSTLLDKHEHKKRKMDKKEKKYFCIYI